MTKYDIQSQVSSCRGRIEGYEDEIRDLRNKISDLDDLRYKVRLAENRMDSYMCDQHKNLWNINEVIDRVKMINDYVADTEILIKGNENAAAMQLFLESLRKIDLKIEELNDEIRYIYGKISSLNSEISSLSHQISVLEV